MKKIIKVTFMALMVLIFAAQSLSVQAKSNSEYILGTFFTSNKDTKLQCFLSEDGINMKHVYTWDKLEGRDFSCQYYNKNFYICIVEPVDSESTFKITILNLDDMKNPDFTSYKVTERDKKYPNIWAPDLFIDDNGSAYVYFSKQKGSAVKGKESKFDIYVSKIDDIEKGVFKAENTRVIKPPAGSGSENWIDAQVRKINDYYYMIIKNEDRITNNDNKSPLMIKSKDPMFETYEVVKSWPLQYLRGYEGFSMLEKGDKIYIYADNFSHKYDIHKYKDGDTENFTSNHTVWIADKANIETGPYKAHYVESNRPMRHGSVILLTDNYMINKFKDTFENNKTESTKKADEKPVNIVFRKEDFDNGNSKGDNVTIEHFAPALDVTYSVPQKANVEIREINNAYGVDKIEIGLGNSSSLKVTAPNVKGAENLSVGKDEKDKFYIFKLDGDDWICEEVKQVESEEKETQTQIEPQPAETK